jgi:hypothetical protein
MALLAGRPSPARAIVGAKGRRRGTVLADLAAEGDRNRVVIPLLREPLAKQKV